MGCDIHVRLERLTENGWEPFEMYREEGGAFHVSEVYGDRDYDLFAALCNVRNYDEAPYVSEPKGLPVDISEKTREYLVDYWDSDGHSHSWNLLEELYQYQKQNSPTKQSGFISPIVAAKLDKGILPQSWCLDAWDETWVYREWGQEGCALDGLILAIEHQIKRLTCCYKPSDFASTIRVVYCFDN